MLHPTMDHAPREIRVWHASAIIHASIPRTVVRTPTVIDHRRDSVDRPPGDRELYDLALNILNVFMEPRRGARGELEPIKCFRGHCSSFAARHHVDFAREFLRDPARRGRRDLHGRDRRVDRATPTRGDRARGCGVVSRGSVGVGRSTL